MSTIVAVLRAHCRNQAASVTQLQTESYRQAGHRLPAGSQVESKDRVGPRLSCSSPCSLLVGAVGVRMRWGDTRDQEEYF